MAIQVKICGINSADAANAAVRAGADFGGLVFHPKSPRALALDAGRALAQHLRDRVRLVAVIADADDEMIGAVVGAVEPDFLQLHGDESVERAAAIAARFRIPLIKAVAVTDASDLTAAAAYEKIVEMLLFDARPPKGAARGGGHGAAFDWRLLKGNNFSKPWFLAGGLNLQNVAHAIGASGAAQVDVSSGVENAPGMKSAALIGEFIAAARTPEKVRA